MLPEPGPVVIGRGSAEVADVHRLRSQVADDGHVAWVDARPHTGQDSLAPFGQDLLTALGCCGNRPPRRVGERHLYRVLPYLRHGDVHDIVVTEVQWLTVPTLRELLTAGAIASVRLWLLTGIAVPEEHTELFAAVTGDVLPWPAVRRLWEGRLAGSAERAGRCPAVRDDWWGHDRPMAPQLPNHNDCVMHPGRVTCLLSAARRALIIGTLDAERMRDGLQAVEANPTTTPEDIWELRDAGRDTYTPAADALAQLLPADDRFVDVHASMLSPAGDHLSLPSGPLAVPEHMRRPLRRQRTTSVLCNGPSDWPLLTLFDKYQRT